MNDKEKILKKTKLIFLIEYIVIGLILGVVGFLRLFDVIPYNDKRLLAYNIITLIGVAYIIFETIWYIISKKKRERSDLIDKILPIPLALFLLVFDILVLAKVLVDINIIKYCIAGVLLYGFAFALFLGIYHHIKPSKMVLEAVEEEYLQKQKELAEQQAKEESKEEEPQEGK